MTEFTPNRKIKYFFGYYNLFGQAAPVVWAEEDGIVVGGIPDTFQKHEITEAEFQPDVHLKDLAQKHPVELDMKVILSRE